MALHFQNKLKVIKWIEYEAVDFGLFLLRKSRKQEQKPHLTVLFISKPFVCMYFQPNSQLFICKAVVIVMEYLREMNSMLKVG